MIELDLLLTDGSRYVVEVLTLPQITVSFLHARITEMDMTVLKQPNQRMLPVPVYCDVHIYSLDEISCPQ